MGGRGSTSRTQRSSSSAALSRAGSAALTGRPKSVGAMSSASRAKTSSTRLSQKKCDITQEGIKLQVYIDDGILERSKTTCAMFAVRHNDKRPIYWYNEVPQA